MFCFGCLLFVCIFGLLLLVLLLYVVVVVGVVVVVAVVVSAVISYCCFCRGVDCFRLLSDIVCRSVVIVDVVIVVIGIYI